MRLSIISLMLVSAGIVAGCSSSRERARQKAEPALSMTPGSNSRQIVAATPKVVIYKMR